MPLTDEEKTWLQKTLGNSTTPSSDQPATPGVLPTGIPAGQPYISSMPIGRMRVTVPPPPAEVQRQLAVDQARLNQRASTLSPDARRIMSQAQAARAQIAQIWDEADRLLPATESSGYSAIAKGLGERVKTEVGGNEPARAFRQTLRAKLRNVARSLGERGVITDKDIEDFMQSMPDFTDSTISRPQKKENLLGGVDALVNAFTQKQYGIPFQPSSTPIGISSRHLPPGVTLAPGLHVDGKGQKFLVHPDGTYELQ